MKLLYSSYTYLFLAFLLMSGGTAFAQNNQVNNTSFLPAQVWSDNNGQHINAHGGGIIYHEGTYYWFGENRPSSGFTTLEGVSCYSSSDLYNWKNEGVALSVDKQNPDSPITIGCIMERPKVIYNAKTRQFVMYFHLELKGQGYKAAQVAIATSQTPSGPYKFIKASRVNAGYWPLNMTEAQKTSKISDKNFDKWWTPEWRKAITEGLFVRRDFEGGQMSRDMTLFVDYDHKAYHIYSSEDNLTLQIAELSDDYLDYTGKYIRIAPGGHNEAPAIFRKDNKYFMITSGCTGWDPNAARLLTSDTILGEWQILPNPCEGRDAEFTFHSQSTYILPVQGKKDAYIFMADRWIPKNLASSGHIWLPITFNKGLPVLKWFDKWDLSIFDKD